ncbi:hypothetical protein [Enterococcus larvae]|uniref:hypothetical protein n=1 Tax=Enterococcus larvae TaxID=2794352 RepID=UPI003F40F21A
MDNFTNRIHRVGRITVFFCLTAFVLSAVVLSWIYGTALDFPVIFKNAWPIILTFTIAGFSENLSYAPIIGPGALYISCITGNLSNIKVPAAINGQKLLDLEPGSEKSDVLSIIIVSVCTIVTTVLMFFGMLFLAPLIEPVYNNPIIKPAFDNLLPALFGALIAPQIMSNIKVNLPIFLVPSGLLLLTDPIFFQNNQGLILLGCALIAIAYSYLMMPKNDEIPEMEE